MNQLCYSLALEINFVYSMPNRICPIKLSKNDQNETSNLNWVEKVSSYLVTWYMYVISSSKSRVLCVRIVMLYSFFKSYGLYT